MIDLHVHSNCSDGTCSPAQLVKLALGVPLEAFALTDHDTTDGIAMAQAAAEGSDLEVIPGIEFSTSYEGKDIHILGLGIQYKDAYFQQQLEYFRDSRTLRNHKMLARLQEYGLPITKELLEEKYPNAVWTRAHFGACLYGLGCVSSVNEAFERYIGDQAPCFVPREKVTPFEAIQLVHEAGGYAVLAHPLLYGFSKANLDILTARLKKAGIDGIEAIYSSNRQSDDSAMKQLADKYSLKITGGSDFHGDNKPKIHLGTGRGNLKVPYSIWKNLNVRVSTLPDSPPALQE